MTFQTGSITSTGTGLRVANSNGGTINFNNPTIALTTGANKAVTLDTSNAGGTINFTPAGGGNGLDISTTTGTGFSALGGGTISVTGTGNTVVSSGGAALDCQRGHRRRRSQLSGPRRRAAAPATSSSRTSPAARLRSAAAASTGATGAAFLVGDGARRRQHRRHVGHHLRRDDHHDRCGADGGHPGPRRGRRQHHAVGHAISIPAATRNGVFLDHNAAGTIAFSAANSVLNGGTSTAVSLTNNTGATINFTGGGLDIDATSGSGFVATGGGTVNVTLTGNTIATTTGTALNVANTTIGASGLTFQSISANGASSGIVLNNTGSSGRSHRDGQWRDLQQPRKLHGRGDPEHDQRDAVSLTNTLNPSFTRIGIQNTSESGIEGTGVTGFTLQNSFIDNSGTGGGADDSNVAFNNQAAGLGDEHLRHADHHEQHPHQRALARPHGAELQRHARRRHRHRQHHPAARATRSRLRRTSRSSDRRTRCQT